MTAAKPILRKRLLSRPLPSTPNAVNLTGQRFSKWLVVMYVGSKRWLCKCDCGTWKSVATQNLTRGSTTGCANCRAWGKGKPKTHGKTYTPAFGTWLRIRARCGRPSDSAFNRYGAKGIRVCKEWSNSFEAFLADMGDRPPGHWLMRIDTNGDFEPDNCEWRLPPSRRKLRRQRSRNLP